MPLRLGQLLFSGRTYQVEIDGEWVFLQLVGGLASEVFCSCGHDSCSHAQQALKIIQGPEPLHERFVHSFFYKLFRQLQSDEPFVEGPENVFVAPRCTIYSQELAPLLRHPLEEQESNSIKFCDVAPEEIERWRQGRASPDFAFELSLWSDIAKHYFILQAVKKVPVRVTGTEVFVGEDRLVTKLAQLPPLDPSGRRASLSWSFADNVLTIEEQQYRGDEIVALFKKESKSLRLKGFPLFESPAPLPLSMTFDGQLKIAMQGHFIGPYVWIEGQGFFQKPPYPAIVKDLDRFIKEHEALFCQKGFEVHHSLPDLDMHFTMDQEGLHFTAADVILTDQWLYMPGKGFYPRVVKGKSSLAGLHVSWQELATFIEEHEEALREVPGFFLEQQPFKQLGLRISLSKGRIKVVPAIEENYPWKLVGPYFVVMGQGVYKVELPAYLKSFEADDSQEFIKNELPQLLPHAIYVDPRLKALTVKLATSPEVHYETAYGALDLHAMAQQLQKGETLLRTEDGYVDLSQARFEWLRLLQSPQLTALDRIRLEAYEKVGQKELWPALEPLPPLPHFKATLRSYQEKGLQWLWQLSQRGLSALLCDDMGLGKTYQALAFVAALQRSPVLILAPTSVIYHWFDKARQCLPDKKVSLFHGGERYFDEKADIIVTSYGIARQENERLKRCCFPLIIFDEVQLAKNRSSLTWAALAGLKSTFRLGLTGTPIENNLKELKSLFDLILPGFFPSAQRFRAQFITPIELQGDSRRKELLQRLIAPFILRRTKKECLRELPAKTEDVLWCELSEEQGSLYQGLLQQSRSVIANLYEDSFSYITLLGLLIQLKKICNHPALFLGDIKNWRQYASGKWELFTDLLEEAAGQKVVVFSHYLGMLDIIEDYLQEQGIGFASLRGSTINRQQQIVRFQNDEQCRVFVASLQAGGLGIDLTAGSTVIHYDRWWNAARENQATDRVHRIGQKLPVQVFKLATRGTVEENIDKLITKKARLLEDIIALDGHTDFKKLYAEDWLEILSFFRSAETESP